MARVEKFGAVGFGISKSEFMGANIFFTKVFCFDKRKKSDAAKNFLLQTHILGCIYKTQAHHLSSKYLHLSSLQKLLQIVYSDCPFQNLFQTLSPVSGEPRYVDFSDTTLPADPRIIHLKGVP
jgi:hypothetical protein